LLNKVQVDPCIVLPEEFSLLGLKISKFLLQLVAKVVSYHCKNAKRAQMSKEFWSQNVLASRVKVGEQWFSLF
jgi:hypothetical protein